MADIYKIGVALAMTSNHAMVLQALSSNLLGVHAQVNQLTGSFTKLQVAIGGAFAIWGGEKVLGALAKTVEAGSKIAHQQELMRQAGISNKEVAEATTRAYEISARVQTTTISENLKHLNELRYAFGDIATAQRNIEQVSKVQAILNNVKPGLSDQVWPLVKALEEKGLTSNPAKFNAVMESMTQSGLATGGRVTPDLFYSTFMFGRTAMQGWSPEFIAGALPRLIQSMSGGGGISGGQTGPGNALMSAFQAIVQGNISRKAAEELQELGILPKNTVNNELIGYGHVGPHMRFHGNVSHGMMHTGHVRYSRSGERAFFDPKAIAGHDLMIENPYEWVQQIMMPHVLKKLGIDASALRKPLTEDEQGRILEGRELEDKDRNAIIREFGKAFQNRTAGSIMTIMGLQGRYLLGENSPFEKDIKLQHGAMGINNAYIDAMSKDPNMVWTAFEAQRENMMQAFGVTMVPTAIKIMREFTEAFVALTAAMAAHPDLFKALGVGLGILGAFLVGAGVVAILAALGPAGWLVLGVGAVVALFATLHRIGGTAAAAAKVVEDSLMSLFGPVGLLFKIMMNLDGIAKIIITLWEKVQAVYQFIFGGPSMQERREQQNKGTHPPIPWMDPIPGPMRYQGPAFGGAMFQRAAYTSETTGGATISLTGPTLILINGQLAGIGAWGGGGGGGGGITSAAFHPSGIGGGIGGSLGHMFGGRGSVGHGGSVSGVPIPHLGAHIPRGSHGAADLGPTPSFDFDSHGMIKGGIDRRSFLKEIHDKPWLVTKMASMVQGEVGKGAPLSTKIVQLETAFNRSQMRHHSLEQGLLSVAENPRLGYYARDTYHSISASEVEKFKRDVLDPVLHGSDLSSKILGRPMTGNASASVAAHQFARGTPGYNLPAAGRAHESYFAEGPIRPLPHLSGSESVASHGAALRAHFGHRGHEGGPASKAIPHPDDKAIHTHTTIELDGRKVAQNTLRHVRRSMNGPAMGSKLPDYSSARPMPV